MSGTKVTAMDVETGESESRVIVDDYVVICDGRSYVANTQVHKNGTHVITIKKDDGL